VPSGLRQRIVTALLLAAALIAVLFWLPAEVTVAAVMLVVAAGAWEWSSFAGLSRPPARLGYTAAVGLAIAAGWWLTATPEALRALLWITFVWWLVAFGWILAGTGRGGSAGAAIAGLMVLAPAAVAIGRLVEFEPAGRTLLFVLVLLVAAADIGAYFGGRQFGRNKLAPQVSPGKTWEGLVAGVLAAGVAAMVTGRLLGMPQPAWLGVCLAVVLFSVVGDLLESMFKRRVGLKDSSGLLPGHGGVLDRVDSLTAAAPAFLLGLVLLGVVG
jgi:phosphatidate cytidylyltransferase